MGKRITDKVTWVGKIDWELKTFHGDELSTHKGTSYNSYLIRDEKTVLIDTVWNPYDQEFVAHLKEEIDLHAIDAIVVNPVDGAATPAMTKLAVDAGIPLVYVNHPPAEHAAMPAGTSFVGSNEIDSGTMQTKAVCEMLGGKGKVLVLMGPLENEASIIRTKDIEDVIATEPCTGMKIVDKQVGNWNRTQGADLTTNWLTSGVAFDAIISNNDEMAIGAIQALKGAGVDMGKVVVAGIDATPDGLAAMEAGDLDVTVFQNATRQGEVALETALAMVGGQKAEGNIWIPFEPVTRENMKDYK